MKPLFNDVKTGTTVTFLLSTGKEVTKPVQWVRRMTPTEDALAEITLKNGRVVPHDAIVSINNK